MEGIHAVYDKVKANSSITRSIFFSESEGSNDSHDSQLLKANGVDKNGDGLSTTTKFCITNNIRFPLHGTNVLLLYTI